MKNDIEQLNLLSVFHYVLGGMGALFSCLYLIQIYLLTVILTPQVLTPYNPLIQYPGQTLPPVGINYLFAVIMGLCFLIGQVISWSIIYSGLCLKRKQKHSYSFVVACIGCLFMPLGTILGVFTIIVLSRDSVKELYANTSALMILEGQTKRPE